MAKLQALADKTLVRGVGTAMSTGDYGDVQTVLSSYSSLGYFEGAAVVNVRQRVVGACRAAPTSCASVTRCPRTPSAAPRPSS